MGSFDDLIPSTDTPPQAPPAAMKFDDLVPEGNMFSDIPSEVYQAAKTAAGTVADTLNPFSEARHAAYARQAAAPTFMGGLGEEASQIGETGKGILAAPQVLAAPITGSSRSLIGHPLATAEHLAGELINPEVAAKDNPAEMYASAKNDVDTAMMGLSPSRAGLGFKPVPIPPKPAGPFGITQTAGEVANDLAMRQAEQNAIRGGDPHAQQFIAQRQAQIQEANKNIVQGLDPLGQTIAQTPQEAGELVSQGVQSAAKTSKAAVKKAYETAEGLGGEIHAGVFENMGSKIKQGIFPDVVVNQQTTPIASQMVDYLDNMPSNLATLNKADPFGAVNPANISGVSLKGVDETRKILSKWRSDAFKPVGDADTRATQAVLNAFDDHIDQAVNGGLFTGNTSAVNAWNNARAANTDYRSTFTPGKNDPVGRVVQKVIGNNTNDPLTPGKVMDQIAGSAVNPSSLNIGVANRLKSILGETSPEWIAAKQGLAQRLIQT